MPKMKTLPAIFAGASIFSLLFYKQDLGLNLVLFEVLFLLWIVLVRKASIQHANTLFFGSTLLLSMLAIFLTNSTLAIGVNVLALVAFVGILNYAHCRSILNTMAIAGHAFIASQRKFILDISERIFREERPGKFLWKYRIFIIPTAIIAFFISIYSQSNPIFDRAVMSIGHFLGERWSTIFEIVNPLLIFTFGLGVLICNFLLRRTEIPSVEVRDQNAQDNLRSRNDIADPSKQTSLANEFKAAVFLLVTLNIILLFLNLADIKLVWINFEWQGEYLKQFVHEGTHLLILSILISIGLVLFFFRGELNFFRNNKILKNLSYLWLAQNAVLAISVAMRNFHYIDHFSLAYKRIGVLVFLALTLYGLFTVFQKVLLRKSSFFLFRKNAFAIFLVLILSALINWDGLIVKYNFKHSNDAFVHLDYLATMSDKTLPDLDYPLAYLTAMDADQKEKYPFEHKFMTPREFNRRIQQRKSAFKDRWESRNLLSWNLPEYMAYQKLFPKLR